jgi:mycofactocin precursor
VTLTSDYIRHRVTEMFPTEPLSRLRRQEGVMSESVATAEVAETTEITGPAGPESAALAAAGPQAGEPQVALTDLLVEEVSIDGMCGVY